MCANPSARPLDWHACYSATYRRYRYTIHNGRRPNLFLSPWSWHRYQHRLDASRMRDALNTMLGLHDFSAFMKAGSRRAHARTTVQEVLVERQGDLLQSRDSSQWVSLRDGSPADGPVGGRRRAPSQRCRL